MRRAGIVGTVALMMTAGAYAPAMAAPGGLPIHIVADTQLEGGTFESSLPNCSTGTVEDAEDVAAHFTPWGGVFIGDKVFTCAGDGGDGFVLALRARFGSQGSTGSWTVVSGSGDFSGLKGSGSLVGIRTSETSIDDVYTGTVR